LHISWCSRCLAEGFANDRPAYIRYHWVLAFAGFCHTHRWPLEDSCSQCGSRRWRFAASARGPLRLMCSGCWQPLERASSKNLYADRSRRDSWAWLAAFESQIVRAAQGLTPDQARFAFTTARQLMDELRDITSLLARANWRRRHPVAPINHLVCPAFSSEFEDFWYSANDGPYPLATVDVGIRRIFLAAFAAIMDLTTDTALFDAGGTTVIERFVGLVDRGRLEGYLSGVRGKWSPALKRRISAALQWEEQRSLTSLLSIVDQPHYSRLRNRAPNALG